MLITLLIFFLSAACNFKVGWPIKARSSINPDGYTFVAPKQQFFCNGEVTMWRYQATTSNGWQAIVFRPLDGNRTEFKVVGINNIPSSGEANTLVVYNVPEGDRIRVQRGDVIGWSFEVGVIPCSFGSDSNAGNMVRWNESNQFALHDIITFDKYGQYECSIETTAQVSMNFTMCLYLYLCLI